MKGQKDYKNAKIYKLVSTVDDNFYIGSTCTTLIIRLCDHKSKAKRHHNRKVYQWLNDVGLANIKIILIDDNFTCENMDHLRREEDKYIMMYKHLDDCMNSNRAYLTLDEKKEKEAERKRIYNENNKEKISCIICGSIVSSLKMNRHKKTNKCFTLAASAAAEA